MRFNIIKLPIEKAAGLPKPAKPKATPSGGGPAVPGAGGGVGGTRPHKYIKRERSKKDPKKWVYWYKLPDGKVVSEEKPGGNEQATQQMPAEQPSQLPQEVAQKVPQQFVQRFDLTSEEVKQSYPDVINPSTFKASLPTGINVRDLQDMYNALNSLKKEMEKQLPVDSEDRWRLSRSVNSLLGRMDSNWGKENLIGKPIRGSGQSQGSQKEVESGMLPSEVQNWLSGFNEKINSGIEAPMGEIEKYNRLSKKLDKYYSDREDKRVTEKLEHEEAERARLARENINEFIDKATKKKKFDKGIETKKLPESVTEKNKQIDKKLTNSVTHTLNILFKNKPVFKVKKIIPGQKSYSVIVDLDEGADRNKLNKYNNFTKLNGKVISNSDGTVSIQFLNSSIKNTLKVKDMEERNKIGLKATIESIQRQALESQKMHGFKGAFMSLGVDPQGKPITINLADDNTNNIATLGLPGGGKSYSMINGLLSLGSVYDPTEIQFDLVDGGEKSTTFNGIDENMHKYLASDTIHGVKGKEDVSGFVRKLDGTLQEMANRGEIMGRTGVDKITELPEKQGKQLPIRMLVVDELQALYNTIDSLYPVKEAKDMKQEITGKLSRIQTGGRKYGVKSWILGQTLDHSDKNFPYLKPLFGRADVKTQLRSNRSSAQAFTGRYAYANPNSPQGLAQIFSPNRDEMYTSDTPDRTQDEKIIFGHVKTK